MLEYIRAHATYRFVILDEEYERPRFLVSGFLALMHARITYNFYQIWLFKPSIRLSYRIPTEYFNKKSASIHAAKVLYKVIPPSASSMELKRCVWFAGYPQEVHNTGLD